MGKTADTQQTRERDLQRLYSKDPYSWARAQAEAFHRRDTEAIDWDNVTAEIEDLAREAEHRLKGQYRTVIRHFLLLQYGEGCDLLPHRSHICPPGEAAPAGSSKNPVAAYSHNSSLHLSDERRPFRDHEAMPYLFSDYPRFHELRRAGWRFSPSSAPYYPQNASWGNFGPIARKKRP